MKTTRLEAFSDGVIAIIITIMVLELKVPQQHSLRGLLEVWPTFMSYVLSFLFVAIVWVNHHHMIHLVRNVNAPVLWANLNLLFWLSLIPFGSSYLGENHATPMAVAVYGALTMFCALAYYLLRHCVSCQTYDDPKLSALHVRALHKNRIAVGIYLAVVPTAYLSTWLALALIALPPVMYFIPDRQVEELAGD